MYPRTTQNNDQENVLVFGDSETCVPGSGGFVVGGDSETRYPDFSIPSYSDVLRAIHSSVSSWTDNIICYTVSNF